MNPVKKRIHALLARCTLVRPAGGLFTKQGMDFLRLAPVRCYHRQILDDSLAALEHFNTSIKALDKRLMREAAERDAAQILMSMPGIGSYSALMILAEIDDVRRFPSPKHLCSYARLVPSIRNSGGKTRHGSITKEGSPWLRTVMIEAAQVAVRYSPTLCQFREWIALKHGRNAAKVAVARKMLTALYWMLQRGKCYQDPLVITGSPEQGLG